MVFKFIPFVNGFPVIRYWRIRNVSLDDYLDRTRLDSIKLNALVIVSNFVSYFAIID